MTNQDLKDWRKELRLTQDHAAFLMGITKDGWRRREIGESKVLPETRYAMEFLRVNPEEITARLKDFPA